jgi:hypothetical protein
VLALSTLRASAKDPTASAGRFGVGFAAVLAVTDAPAIGSRGQPAVAWSAARTAELVAVVPELAGDLVARGGHVPILRLPFAREPLPVPEGYDTAVWLPWRDGPAAALASRLLAALDPTLPLVLPGITEIRVVGGGADRTLTCRDTPAGPLLDGRQWRAVERTGPVPPELLAGRPAEERALDTWTVRAWVPADGGALPGGVAPVLRAPTATDEPLSLPVVLVASVPLEPTRRRAVRGPLTDLVLAAAGDALAALAVSLDEPFPLIPTGLAAGDLDAAVRAALLAALRSAPVCVGRRPDESVVLDLGDATGTATAVLSELIDGLLPASWTAPARAAALTALGVRRLSTADVVELLAGIRRSPAFWRTVYTALALAPDQDALAALPVPLADGRTVTGAGGALLPLGTLPEHIDGLPLRVVHPNAAHPLLERLGAQPADDAALLADPAVRAEVEAADGDLELARAVAELVRSSGAGVDRHPWLIGLALPVAGGGTQPAGDLLWPGGAMAALVDPDAGFSVLDPPGWLDRDTALSLGVADRPVLLHFSDVVLDGELDRDGASGDGTPAELDGLAEWVESIADAVPVGVPLIVSELVAIRDLDAVADLPELLTVIAADRALRAAVVDPVQVGGVGVRSYAAWWLGNQPLFAGRLPRECVLAGIPDLAGLYDPAPAELDPALLAALGVRTGLASVLADADDLGDLLDRLGDADRVVSHDQVVRVHAAVAREWTGRLDEAPDPPLAARALGADGKLAAVPVGRCVLVDAPDLVTFARDRGLAVVPAPASAALVLSELLDVDLASELDPPVPAGGTRTAVPAALLTLLPDAPSTFRRHRSLRPAWRWAGGVLHATDAGLPHGLAWAAGRWELRQLLVAAASGDPEAVLAERVARDLEG